MGWVNKKEGLSRNDEKNRSVKQAKSMMMMCVDFWILSRIVTSGRVELIFRLSGCCVCLMCKLAEFVSFHQVSACIYVSVIYYVLNSCLNKMNSSKHDDSTGWHIATFCNYTITLESRINMEFFLKKLLCFFMSHTIRSLHFSPMKPANQENNIFEFHFTLKKVIYFLYIFRRKEEN